jgi:acetyl-CoA carboxylase biotin carboxyl carrier protein
LETPLGTDSTSLTDGADDQLDGSIGEASATIVQTVSDLVTVMNRGGITELDLDYLDVRIRLRVGTPTVVAQPTMVAAAPVAAAPAAAPAPAPVVDEGRVVTAPMVGTYYAAPSPQDPPFVQVGDRIRTGQVVGIIEAMKIMNEIAADTDGLVTEVVATNGQPVEYGSVILRLAPVGS